MSLLYFRDGISVPFNTGLMSKNLTYRRGRVHSHGSIISIIRGNCNTTIVLEWTCGLPIVYDLQYNSIVSVNNRDEFSSSKTDNWTSWGIKWKCCRMYTFIGLSPYFINERSRVRVLLVSILSLFYNFSIRFGTVLTVLYFMISILFIAFD